MITFNLKKKWYDLIKSGEKHTIGEWAEILGINRSTLNNRYHRGDRGERLFEQRRYKCHA